MAMPRDILVVTLGVLPASRGQEVKDAAEHPTTHRTISNNQEVSGPKYQQLCGQKLCSSYTL